MFSLICLKKHKKYANIYLTKLILKNMVGENMSKDKYDALKIEGQLCFPLYACSREVIKKYKPFLDKLDMTYTQYIAMLVLWEKKSVTVKEMGEFLYLDSGTLTPLLKKMESKGLLTRQRSSQDERILIVTITPAGEALKEQAVEIPYELGRCCPLEAEDSYTLYKLLYKLLKAM